MLGRGQAEVEMGEQVWLDFGCPWESQNSAAAVRSWVRTEGDPRKEELQGTVQ